MTDGPANLRNAVGAATRPRLVVLLVVVAYFICLALLGGRSHWGALGVAPGSVAFGDLRSVTSGWECTRNGIDILELNPCDQGQRPANYPRIWMSLSALGLGTDQTVILGLLIAGVFLLAALLIIPSSASLGQALMYSLALCSPAVMLGVERGNVDLLIFAMLALAVALFRRRWGALLASTLIVLCAMLKLFPLLAAGVLARAPRRQAATCLGAVLAAFLGYALVIRHDLAVLWRVTPQPEEFSYGIRLLSEWAATAANALAPGASRTFRAWDLALLAAALGLALWTARRSDPLPGPTPPPGRQATVDLFVAGAGIYLGSYAFTRNFDYRLVFLLFALPQVIRWSAAGDRIARVALVGLLGTLWLDPHLTADVPMLGRLVRAWSDLTVVGPDHRPLALAEVAQFVLFTTLLSLALRLARPTIQSWRQRTRHAPLDATHEVSG